MKACLLEHPAPIETNPLRFTDVQEPVPGAGEVLIRVSCCAVCRTDLHVTEGELPPRRSPVIPGHQIVGTVVATGEDTAAVTVGQRVGVAWLRRTCGTCRYCVRGRENLCALAAFTGWT